MTAVRQRAALCPREVFKEKCWFEQSVTSPEDVVNFQLDQSLLRQYQEKIWHKDPCENLPQFGMTVDEMSYLCNDAELLPPHMIWMTEQLNRIQKKAVCLYLQGSPAGSLIPHLQRRGLVLKSVKRLVAVASVAKDLDNAVHLSNESGSHWVLVVVELEDKEVYFCDSRAGHPPPNLLKTLQEYCNFFDCQLTPDSFISCHEPTPPGHDQHVCSSDCVNYPLQSRDSRTSSVTALIGAVISACNWEMFYNMISGKRTACYLMRPTDYEAYLRRVLICWFMAGTIDLQNLQLKTKLGTGHRPSSDGTSLQPSTALRSNNRKKLGGKACEELPLHNGYHSSYAVDTETSSEAATKKKTEKVVLECNVCQSKLGSRAALFKHKRSKHPDHEHRLAPEKSLVYCMDCGIRCFKVVKLIEHYRTQHAKQFSIQKKTFASEAEFQTWKKWVEKKTSSLFVQHHGKRCTPLTLVRNFRCNRSGFYVSKGQGKRSLKSKGSLKINAACPAFIKSTEDRVLQSVAAEFCLDHVHECDAKYLNLSADTRKMVAEKLSLGISIDAIVDEVRHSADTTDREYHISRRDVLNVKLSQNLDIDSTAESAYQAEMDSAKTEALQAVEEVTSLIHKSSSVDIVRSVLKHLEFAIKAGKGVLTISTDHDYQ